MFPHIFHAIITMGIVSNKYLSHFQALSIHSYLKFLLTKCSFISRFKQSPCMTLDFDVFQVYSDLLCFLSSFAVWTNDLWNRMFCIMTYMVNFMEPFSTCLTLYHCFLGASGEGATPGFFIFTRHGESTRQQCTRCVLLKTSWGAMLFVILRQGIGPNTFLEEQF